MVGAGTIFFTLQDAKRFAASKSSTPSQDFIIKKQRMKIRGITENAFIVIPNPKGPMFRNPFASVKGSLRGL